ncbi:MAG: lamin tail domain-containing protein [Eubacteriales bacterium]|nr:lamin tail domain-containing protein [Eubacteriales bacterium]
MRKKAGKLFLVGWITAALIPLLFACSGKTSAVSGGLLVVNEVVSSNKRSLADESLGTPDWIELYNAGEAALDLSGYGVSDNLRDLHKFVFPDGTSIGPGEYLLLYATTTEEGSAGSALCTNFGLSKSGDFLFITDAYYGIVAQMEIPPLYTDISYVRAGDGTYGFCAVPSPGKANAGEVYLTLDSVFAAQNLKDLSISEVMPTDSGEHYRWVELYNKGTSAIDLENFCLSDDEGDPVKWQIPSGTVAPGGYLCIYLTGMGSEAADGIHSTFRLSGEDSVLLLSDLQGGLIDRISWQPGVPGGLSILKDASGAGVYTAFPTFEAENSDKTFTSLEITVMDKNDPIHINEALKINTLSQIDEDGDREEWVELKNFSTEPISLLGYFLSDDGDDLYKFALPDITLEPGTYRLVFLSGKNRTGGELHANFSLSEDENDLFLTCLNGMRTESISLAGITRENISVGLDDNWSIRYFAAPTPGSENAHGFETADQIGCFDNTGVFISEVSAVQDVKSGENDWIELCNGSGAAVDLSGWTLSDSPDTPAEFTISSKTIEAGGYLVIECSSHKLRQNADVAPFSISTGGETIVLHNAQGALVDSFDTGALGPDVTSGRIEGDTSVDRVFFSNATRGEENDTDVVAGIAAQPAFSVNSLYHSEPFSVTIRCDDPNATVYYTTDGDEPTARSNAYTGPVPISSNTPLRAVSIVSGKRPSEITTATYLFDEPHSVPVVCVTGDPDRIKMVMTVDDMDMKTEKLVNISYYEADGTLGTSFPAGIKPKGAGTVAYAQKSLSINLRSGYGQSSVTYPFWPDYEFKTFSSLVVRNSGQDWGNARIRDAFTSALVEGMNIDNSATRPVVVYINGKYNGLYDLGEDQNGEFLETHYGVDGDTVEFIRRNSTVIKGDNDDIKRVRSFAETKDLSDDEVFAQFSQWVDVAYFTDYFIAQTYICNSDMFNQKYWRTTDYAVKWRPVFYDLDFAFKTAERDMIGQYFNAQGVPSADKSLTYFEIYIGLKKNKAWRDYCVERYVEVVEKYFNAERATALLDQMAAAIRPEMPRQIERWGKPYSMSEWEEQIKQLRYFVKNRPSYALENMRKYFGVSQNELDALIQKYKQS